MSEPIRAGDAPMGVDLEEGKVYAWCACGRSGNQPFCDGSHKGSGISPSVFTAEKTRTYYMCLCKGTNNKPYCDGTHNS